MMHIEGDDRPVATADQWRRVSLVRAFLVLMIPVTVLSMVSYLLWRAIAQSTPETFEDIHFWFYFFDVGREINVPTWFSAGLWILIGVLAGYYARHAIRARISWGFFSFVAVFLSLDETLELHERLDVLGNELARFVPVQLGFTWVIPGVLIAGVLCALLLRLVLSLPRTVMAGLLVSGVVFVSGSVGAESLSGMALVNGEPAPSFFVLTLIEETLEMTGLALCLASLLHVVEHRRVDGGTAYRTAADRRAVATGHSGKPEDTNHVDDDPLVTDATDAPAAPEKLATVIDIRLRAGAAPGETSGVPERLRSPLHVVLAVWPYDGPAPEIHRSTPSRADRRIATCAVRHRGHHRLRGRHSPSPALGCRGRRRRPPRPPVRRRCRPGDIRGRAPHHLAGGRTGRDLAQLPAQAHRRGNPTGRIPRLPPQVAEVRRRGVAPRSTPPRRPLRDRDRR